MKLEIALLLVLITSGVFAQNNKVPTGKAKTAGRCSPAVTGNNNIFYFRYCGSDPQQARKIVQLLNEILENQDMAASNTKLDELLLFASKPMQSQANSGGINVEQGTIGANSPIVDSPITVGNMPKSISPEEMAEITAFLQTALTKSRIEIHTDQYSSSDPFSRNLYKAFKDASWNMAEPGVNSYQVIGIGVATPQVIVTERGDPISPGQQVHILPTDPAFYPLKVLSVLGLTPTLTRNNTQPGDLIIIDLRGGFSAIH